jgi:predicted MFS family arabinose efflux permease
LGDTSPKRARAAARSRQRLQAAAGSRERFHASMHHAAIVAALSITTVITSCTPAGAAGSGMPWEHEFSHAQRHQGRPGAAMTVALRRQGLSAAGEMPALPRFLERDARAAHSDRPRAKLTRPKMLPLPYMIATVLLPFAAGYYLSYVFRTINAVIASNLAMEFRLGPAELGFMTSIYFLAFVAVQLPAGVALDRYGPRRVQSALLLVAAAGSLLFASADSVAGLMLGRALIGLGVAISLMAGLKAIVLWVPAERVALANGWMVMLGALGAVTATTPAETLIEHLGWRGLFWLLTWLCAVCALLIYAVVPEASTRRQHAVASPLGLRAIYVDPRFWRIAPMSAMTIATSWSI